MTEGSVSPDATLEEPPIALTVPGKLLLPHFIAVLGTDAGVQGGAKVVARLVAHGLKISHGIEEILPKQR